MSLDGAYHELEVTLNLELLVTFGMSLEGVCLEFHYKLAVYMKGASCDQKCLKKPLPYWLSECYERGARLISD